MTLSDNIFTDVGRTLIRPWREEVSPWQALAVFLLFSLLVWWVVDALLIQNNLLKKAEALLTEGA